MAVGEALSLDIDRAREWAADMVARFMPAAIAMLNAQRARNPASEHVACVEDAVCRAASQIGLIPAEVNRFEIASSLGLRATTTAAIRIELARRQHERIAATA